MKSKEALERIKTHIILLEEKVGIDKTSYNPYTEDYKIVKKDLEILELLHKYSYTFQNETIYIAVDCMDLYDKEKIKEWLNNGNN